MAEPQNLRATLAAVAWRRSHGGGRMAANIKEEEKLQDPAEEVQEVKQESPTSSAADDAGAADAGMAEPVPGNAPGSSSSTAVAQVWLR